MTQVVVTVLVIAAVVLPPLLHLVAWRILHLATKASDDPVMALLERLRVAQCGAIGSSIISFLAVNGALGRPIPIHPPVSTGLVALALLIIAAPAGAFIWLFRTGRFGDRA